MLYNKILFKLSGEALGGGSLGLSQSYIQELSKVLIEISQDVNMGIVLGGGNFFRGRDDNLLSRTTSDYIGMLGTVMNGLALRDLIIANGGRAFLVSALFVPKLSVISSPIEINERINKGEIAIFVSGTGNPYFSTDTTAAFRALEIGAEIVLFGKNGVDGVYDKDPKEYPNAKRYDSLTMTEILEQNLKVIDHAACSLFKENSLAVRIFGMDDLNNLKKVLEDKNIGTHVRGE